MVVPVLRQRFRRPVPLRRTYPALVLLGILVGAGLSSLGHPGGQARPTSHSPPLPPHPIIAESSPFNRALAATSCPGSYTPENLSVIDGSANRLAASVPVGSNPLEFALDPVSGDIFVTNDGSANVTVINGSTDSLVATIGVQLSPYSVAYDRINGDVYVANYRLYSGYVTVLNATNLSVVTTISVPGGKLLHAIVVDPNTDTVYVGSGYTDNLSVINGTSNTFAKSIPVGNSPFVLALNASGTGLISVNEGSANISVINTTTESVARTVGVGLYPDTLAFAPATNEIYVGDYGSGLYGNLTVLNATTDRAVTTISVGSAPTSVVYDPANQEIYAATTATAPPYYGVVRAVNTSTHAIVRNITVGYNLQELAFDAANGDLYASDWGPGDVAVINGTTNNLSAAVAPWNGSYGGGAILVDPRNGEVYVVNQVYSSGAVDFEVSVDETGLPTGTSWSYDLTWPYGTVDTASGNSTCLWINEPNGTVRFTVNPVSTGPNGSYVPTPASGNLTISGTSVNVSVTFGYVPAYAISFNESGLPNGTGWSVDFDGYDESSSNASIVVYEPNGSYWFSAGWVAGYSPSPAGGTVSVAGADVSEPIHFSARQWALNFTEFGLPSGTSWTVQVNGINESSATSLIGFSLPNGNYSYSVGNSAGFVPVPSMGIATIQGWNTTVEIRFALPTYAVAIGESGLPNGTSWGVVLNGSSESAFAPAAIDVSATNGTYNFSVGAVLGFYSELRGNVTVAGTPSGVVVAFFPTLHTITFRETGLPNGTGWGVVIGSAIETSLSPTIAFLGEPNGSYGYVVLAISGYTTSYSGVATVNGSDRAVGVPFAAQTYPVVIVEVGLANGTNWSVTIFNQSTGFNESAWSTTNAIVLQAPNGTYEIRVSVPAGYTAGGTPLPLVVDGRVPPSLTVSFVGHSPLPAPRATAPPPAIPPLPLVERIALAVVGVVGVATAGLLWLVLRRRPPARTAEAAESFRPS
jgi:YVTN family beta-propeller protein